MLGLVRRGDPNVARTQAPVSRWDPWADFSRIRSDMDSLFSSVFTQSPDQGSGFTPSIDLFETPEEYVLSAYLPGMSQEDIHLEVVGPTIHVWGESKPNFPQNVTVHLAQGAYGKFDLRYSMPVDLNAEAVTAAYRNGVLEIHLPKAETSKPKTVQVQVQS